MMAFLSEGGHFNPQMMILLSENYDVVYVIIRWLN